MTHITRRSFLKSGALSLGLAAGGTLGILPRSLRAAWTPGRLLVYVFLRGGIDGLNLVAPRTGVDRAEYEAKRPNLKLPLTGTNAMLPLSSAFGLNSAASSLHELYQDGHLAIVHACGMPLAQHSRSHFDAQDYIEHGTPGSSSIGTGWLARHLAAAGQVPASADIPVLSAGSGTPVSLRGESAVMTLDQPSDFHPNADSNYALSHLTALRSLYQDGDSLDLAVQRAMDTVDVIQSLNLNNYTPAGGAEYPSSGVGGSLGNQCKLIANVASRNLGMQVATVDFGGWDTHENQGNGDTPINQSQYANRVQALSDTLSALYIDLAARGLGEQLTVVVQSEFGRRIKENANRGTDHGTGNPLLVLGGRVNGGLYGTFPGLLPEQLYDGNDVRTTTDFRRVMSELLVNHLGQTNLPLVFPGYSYNGPLGVLRDDIFSNGFEG